MENFITIEQDKTNPKKYRIIVETISESDVINIITSNWFNEDSIIPKDMFVREMINMFTQGWNTAFKSIEYSKDPHIKVRFI